MSHQIKVIKFKKQIKLLKLFAPANIIKVTHRVIFIGRLCMEYLTTSEIAKKWGISARRVQILCKEGRIKGAVLKGRFWLIPISAKKPENPRKSKGVL